MKTFADPRRFELWLGLCIGLMVGTALANLVHLVLS
jgi:hypothetical protein